MDTCPHCRGYGEVQVYCVRVMRVYCDCVAGDRRVEKLKKALEEVGLDPEDTVYQWPRHSEYWPPRYPTT